ncbi:MAG: hypothetical protein E6K08_10010 [Methanobacteriota archaeon]|nr:MAG: hypothetical protein E6K08_10010 [Euryarchaeota archaeon]
MFGEVILLEKRLDAILEVLQVRIAAFRRPQSVIDETDSPKFCEQVLQSFALKAEVLLEPVRRRGLPVFPRVVVDALSRVQDFPGSSDRSHRSLAEPTRGRDVTHETGSMSGGRSTT